MYGLLLIVFFFCEDESSDDLVMPSSNRLLIGHDFLYESNNQPIRNTLDCVCCDVMSDVLELSDLVLPRRRKVF